MKRNPEFCPYCGHVILDDSQKYCDYCGSVIEKEEVPKKQSVSYLGSIGALLFIIFIIIILVVKK